MDAATLQWLKPKSSSAYCRAGMNACSTLSPAKIDSQLGSSAIICADLRRKSKSPAAAGLLQET
jgi:hypothetical protein